MLSFFVFSMVENKDLLRLVRTEMFQNSPLSIIGTVVDFPTLKLCIFKANDYCPLKEEQEVLEGFRE